MVDELRTKTNADKQWSISVQRNSINGEPVDSTDPEGIQEGSALTKSQVTTGQKFLGSTHLHPNGTYPMFSWRDLTVMLNTYSEASTSFKEDTFLMIVNDDGSIYALQVTDFAVLNNRLNVIDWAIAELNGEDPEFSFDKDFRDIYDTPDSDFEKAFLHDLSLSKATDDQLDNWETLTLNEDGEVISVPCD